MNSDDKVLVVGGLGNVGKSIVKHLIGHKVITVLETREKIQKFKAENQDDFNYLVNCNVDFLIFEDEKFFKLEDSEYKAMNPILVNIIFAVRFRENIYHKNSFMIDSELENLSIGFTKVVLPLLKIIKSAEFNSKKDFDRKIIAINSSNASSISHQPLSYHALNAINAQIFKYLSVSLQKINVKVFIIEVGVINPLESNEEIINAVNSISPPSAGNELTDLIDFLLSTSGYGLVGNPILLTAARNLLDSTAVAEKVFGDLTVRKNLTN
jgi:NAD(P)-dependent dehydrogenase (short-subunit alcohol dehydrogenase family)